MKDFLDKNRILLGALALTLIAGLVVIAQRWGVEAENKTYDVVLDYSELELLAEQSEHDIAWWLEQFRDMGITRVGLTEESLSSLMEKSPMAVTATMMDELMQDANWRSNYPERFVRQMEERGYDRFDVLVEVAGQEAIDFVTEAIGARFPAGSFLLDIDNGLSSQYRYEPVLRAYILLDGSVNDTLYEATYSYRDTKGKGFAERNDIASSKLMAISLGLMPEKVELIQGLGMEIIPRTMSYNGHNDTRYAQAVVAGYEKHGIVPEYIIAGGEAVIGYDDGEFALDYIRDNHITVGLIETNVQRENIIQSGIEKVARGTDLNTVRVFSVWNYIQFRYGFYGYEGAEEIENTLFRTIVERNIRVIYFKPIKQTSNSYAYITDIGVYRDMFDGLNARLARHGISMGGDGKLSARPASAAGAGAGSRNLRGAAAGDLPAHAAEMDPGAGGSRRRVRGGGLGGDAQYLPAALQLRQRSGFRLFGRRILPPGRQAGGTDHPRQVLPPADSPGERRGAGDRGASVPGRGRYDRRAPLLHRFHAGAGDLPGGQGGAAAAAGLLLPAVCGLLRLL